MGFISTRDVASVRVVTFDNPPINALSFALSAELLEVLENAEADESISSVVFTGAGGTFSGGADINDFQAPLPPNRITLRNVIARVERGNKTYLAAIDGNALGGGLELALACDYRIATSRSKLGLPEIKIGLIPGAGGTQRLPRLIGAQRALEFMLKGETISAAAAKELGILDEVAQNEADLFEAAVARIEAVITSEPKRRVSERKAEIAVGAHQFMLPFMVAQAHKMVPPEENGGLAAHKLADAVQASIELPFARGLAREFRLFGELVVSPPARALMHLFFAERELAKIPGLPDAQPAQIVSAGIVGAGTMGTGIAIAFASAGLPVTVVEPRDEQIERSKQMIFGMFSHQVQRGKLTQEEAWKRAQAIVFENDMAALKDADIIVEAAFENMEIKKEIFRKLDALAKPEAILASNTSTLDIDAMAAETSRPGSVLGMHFFAPANIMKLVEVVRGAQTSPRTLATVMKLAKTLRKIGVLSGNAFGFIGNRMLFDYAREAIALAEEGVSPARVDAAVKGFGFAMGPFAMFDLSGIDVFWHIQQDRPFSPPGNIIDRLYALERLGQKSGAGFYRYAKGSREPIPDPQVEALFAEIGRARGITPREVADAEIVLRLTHALINAGAEVLREGVALRPGDIDIVYIYGYGFPPHHGGPMWYAQELGVCQVVENLRALCERLGPQWEPSSLLVEQAAGCKEFVHA